MIDITICFNHREISGDRELSGLKREREREHKGVAALLKRITIGIYIHIV